MPRTCNRQAGPQLLQAMDAPAHSFPAGRPFGSEEERRADGAGPVSSVARHEFRQIDLSRPPQLGEHGVSGPPVSSLLETASASSPIQLNGKGGKGRRRRKTYKNDRKKRAFQKRDFEGGYPPRSTTEEPKAAYDRPSKRERDLEREQKRKARTPTRDDSQMHFKEPTGDTIRVYRAEVEKFNDKFSHVDVSGGRAHVYNPPPKSKDSLPVSGEGYDQDEGGYFTGEGPTKKYLTKRTPRKDESNPYRYGKKFLRGREDHPQGTMNWQNFGEAERALEFHQQKSRNPTEQRKGNKFTIKSFEVPSDTYRAIRDDTVHERQRKKHPTKAINVDRESPNQFGLQQKHVELLNQVAIEGSARVEDPEKLTKSLGLPPTYGPPTKPKKSKPKKSKSKRPQLGHIGDPIQIGLENYYDEF